MFRSLSEEWRFIPGFEGYYEVSNHGRVRSVDRVVQTRQGLKRYRGVLRKTSTGSGVYEQLPLSVDDVQTTVYVHSAVLLAFVGPCPQGMEVCHNDGDPRNNHLSNLRYGTHVENTKDFIDLGRHFQLEKSTCPSGHPYDYATAQGRRCRECDRAANRRSYWKRKNAAVSR